MPVSNFKKLTHEEANIKQLAIGEHLRETPMMYKT